MKTIFIRGVPGTGKTLVANILGKILSNSKVIHVDKLKVQAMKKLKNTQKNIEKSREIAYEQTLKELELFQDKNCIILEEVICDKYFLQSLIEFLNKTKSNAYWFRLMRPIKKLLEVESNRKRKVKNTQEDLFKINQDIKSLKIKNEYWIKNDNLALTLKKILNIIV